MGERGIFALSNSIEHTIQEISTWIEINCPGSSPFAEKELEKYDERKLIAGWQVPFELNENVFNIDVVLPEQFPWKRPLAFCRRHFTFLKFPHIERDGAFCLYPNLTEHDPLNPVGLFKDVIIEAVRLIEHLNDPKCAEDFLSEFSSYWQASETSKKTISLLIPFGSTRKIKLWRGKHSYFLADDSSTFHNWWRNQYGKADKTKLAMESALHICLERPIFPSEYPSTGHGILSLTKALASNALPNLEELLTSAVQKTFISFEGRTAGGPVFFGVDILPPKSANHPRGHKTNPLTKGFRPGRVPPKVTLQRLLGANPITKYTIERADPSWVHGRDHEKISRLTGAKIIMVGCGSIGSGIVQQLAQSGVGSMVLIDPEVMEYANAGRHSLGVSHVDKSKSEAMANVLRRDYPHLEVEGKCAAWQSVYDATPELFHEADLIVSTVGSWLVEARLNQVFLTDNAMPPVLFGWSEPFAVAAHSVLIGRNGSCFACGLNSWGTPKLQACEWSGKTEKKEPSCGTHFQPYGPVALSNVISMISRSVLDCLDKNYSVGEHRIYVAPENDRKQVGGQLTDVFASEIPTPLKHGGTITSEWQVDSKCGFCGGDNC